MLTEEEKTKIRLEEVYRFEVQKDLTPDTKQKKWYQSVWSLLNSTFTIFFLSSIVLGGITACLNSQHEKQQQELDLDNQRVALLESYFDRMERQIDRFLFLNSDDEEFEIQKIIVRTNIRGRTLAILPKLDVLRKGLVIDYLYGTDTLLLLDGLLLGADLREADLDGRTLSRADLSGANLQKANLSGTDLSFANLRGADLRGADLSYANLFSAETDGKTQLDSKWQLVLEIVTYGAENRDDLDGADLSRANLTFVNLRGADLSKVNLDETDLRNAEYNNDTQWPKDFDLEAAGAVLKEN